MKASFVRVVAASLGLLVVLPLHAQDDAGTRLEEMKQLVRPLQAFALAGETRTRAQVGDEPMLRWSDPTRANGDGSLWAIGTTGRPLAAVAVELYPNRGAHGIWFYEFVSLSTGLIEVDGGPGFEANPEGTGGPAGEVRLHWTPAQPGVAFDEVPGAPVPGDTEAKRLRQLKALASRFTGDEYLLSSKQTYSLRLSPRPIHRYHDSAAGILDGAVFEFSHGTNPEILLLIEALIRDGKPAGWQWAAARLTTAEPALYLDRKRVWSLPTPPSSRAPTDTYGGAAKARRAPTEK